MHRLPVRVYYEDTDFGGVVYYANYLAYMERARNACLRQLGFLLGVLKDRFGMLFVVTDVSLRYLMPARLDDDLEVSVDISRLGRASVEFTQQVCRGGDVLVAGDTRLGIVDAATFRPRRMPTELSVVLGEWTAAH